VLADAIWERFRTVIRQHRSPSGAPSELVDRDFVEAVLYISRVGCPWRDLPKQFGDWNAVYQRFRRWEKRGIWKVLFEELPEHTQELHELFVDSTIIRAHVDAAGAPAKTGGNRLRD